MNVYHFHHETREYLGSSEPDTDPLDPDNVLVPAFATLTEPLEPSAGFAVVFADDEWSHIADHRNEFWWEASGKKVQINFLGDPAERGLLDEEPEIQPEPPTLADYENAIQATVDAMAKEKLFRDGVTLASYTASTNPQWAAEAAAFVAWRDQVWAYAYSELAKVQSGQREQPAVGEFLAEIHPIEWPTSAPA